MRLAWYAAALERQKKLPDLKTLVSEKPEARPQSGKHHVLMLRMLGLKGQRAN